MSIILKMILVLLASGILGLVALRLNFLVSSITLIGMSNQGKTFWARDLEQRGFNLFCVDDEIEKLLEPELKQQGYRGIADVAAWMTQPHDPQHQRNAALYLQYEKQVMWQVINRLWRGERLVVDTTGSVVHCGWLIMLCLRLLSRVVLLDASEEDIEEMFRKFREMPKPVIWGDLYQPLPGEDSSVALKRCYPLLLEWRNKRYRFWAHIWFAKSERRSRHFTGYHLCLRAGVTQ